MAAALSEQVVLSEECSIDLRVLAAAILLVLFRSDAWLLRPCRVGKDARLIVVDLTAVTNALEDHDMDFLCRECVEILSLSSFSDPSEFDNAQRSSLCFKPFRF